jgi:hypothetical protein
VTPRRGATDRAEAVRRRDDLLALLFGATGDQSWRDLSCDSRLEPLICRVGIQHFGLDVSLSAVRQDQA